MVSGNTAEIQGLATLDYGTKDEAGGSLVPLQDSLIDMLLSGSWRAKNQQEGTMGSTDNPAPDQTVNTAPSAASTTIGKIPVWAFILVGIVAATALLKGK